MQRLRLFPLLVLMILFVACAQKETTQAASGDATGPATAPTPPPVQVPQSQPPALPVVAPPSAALQPAVAQPVDRPPVIQTRTFDIPAGTAIGVRNNEPIDSSQVVPGQMIPAQLNSEVRDAHGRVVIPRGANARLVVESASKAGKIKGSADLVVLLQSVSVGGRRHTVHTNPVREQGSKGIGKNKRTGKFVGGGAAAGGILGAIVGGGKGALIGGASGAAVGGTAQVMTREKSIKIPAGTPMTFRLQKPIQVVEQVKRS